METSRVLVLTTTANAEDVLLVIKMENAERRSREKLQDSSVLVADNEGALREMESIQFESTENIVSLQYSEASLGVIERDLECKKGLLSIFSLLQNTLQMVDAIEKKLGDNMWLGGQAPGSADREEFEKLSKIPNANSHPNTFVFRLTSFPEGYPDGYDLPSAANVAAYPDRGCAAPSPCPSTHGRRPKPLSLRTAPLRIPSRPLHAPPGLRAGGASPSRAGRP